MSGATYLESILGQDLTGYQLIRGFYIRQDHGLMAFTTAVVGVQRQVIVCKDKTLAEEVSARLNGGSRKIIEFKPFLWSARTGRGWFIDNECLTAFTQRQGGRSDVALFTEFDLQNAPSEGEEAIRWGN